MKPTWILGPRCCLGVLLPFFSRSPGARTLLRDAPEHLSLSLFLRKSSDEELLFLCLCLPLQFPPAGTVQTERSRVAVIYALQARHCFRVRAFRDI